VGLFLFPTNPDFECNWDYRQLGHRIPGMTCLRVDIVSFADESQPGFVHCAFVDANGDRHSFVEKIPVVTTGALWSDSTYPQPGMVRARRLKGCGTMLVAVWLASLLVLPTR
jgi:hypothetical protein